MTPSGAGAGTPRDVRLMADIFRQEALDYHLRDPESSGVIGVRPRWTWPVIAGSVLLVTATAVYVFVAWDVVRAIFERLWR